MMRLADSDSQLFAVGRNSREASNNCDHFGVALGWRADVAVADECPRRALLENTGRPEAYCKRGVRRLAKSVLRCHGVDPADAAPQPSLSVTASATSRENRALTDAEHAAGHSTSCAHVKLETIPLIVREDSDRRRLI